MYARRYVEDDVVLNPALFELLPGLLRLRMRMDVPATSAEDRAAGKHAFLTNHPNKDPQDHLDANGKPWTMLWLARQVCGWWVHARRGMA